MKKPVLSSILIIYLFICLSLFSNMALVSSITTLKASSAAIFIHNDSDFTTLGFSGNGSEINPYLLENLEIQTLEDNAIEITGTTKFFIIQNCILNSKKAGIYIHSVANWTAKVVNNEINRIRYGYGIQILDTHYIEITRNTIKNSETAIVLTNSDFVNITSNTCLYNSEGLNGYNCFSSLIKDNRITNNIGNGMTLSSMYFPIIFNNTIKKNYRGISADIYYGQIANNTIVYNNYHGITLDSIFTTVKHNLILQNEFFGIACYGSFNTLHHNILIDNSKNWWYWWLPRPEATSEGQGNVWYDKSINEGNYWFQWDTSVPYDLEGVMDLYPWIAPDGDEDLLDDIVEENYYNTDIHQNDTDSDGLLDGEEVYIYESNPLLADTDYDTIIDGEEVYLYGTIPILSDSDADLLRDPDELFIYFTDPLDFDSDDDGLPDGWEVDFYLNPLFNDSYLDLDNDGLSNLLEYVYRCNPLVNDTDGDTLLDGDEVLIYGSSPQLVDSDKDGISDGDEVFIYGSNPSKMDSDDDGLLDFDEIFIYLTLPSNNDSDGDLMPDGWEVKFTLNPLINDAQNDPDSDLLTNYEEYLLGTNPNDWDTDGDEYSDGKEVKTGHDPLDPLDFPLSDSVKLPLIIGIPLLSVGIMGIIFFKLLKQKFVKRKLG